MPTFGGLTLLFCMWGGSEAPNPHRIRAALIYREVAPTALSDDQAGRIRPGTPAPAALRAIAMKAAAKTPLEAGDFERALYLARLLILKNYPAIDGAKTGPEIQLNRIRIGSAAYCSDYTEAFLGLCAAAGIPAREWGITADRLRGPRGHSLVEIYARKTGKWQILDPFVGGWPSRANRLRRGIGILDYVRGSKADILWNPIVEQAMNQKPVRSVYDANRISLFLIDGQRIFDPVRKSLPVAIRQLVKILAGSSFRFSFPILEGNRKLLAELRTLRISLLGAGISGLLFLFSLPFFLVCRHRNKREIEG